MIFSKKPKWINDTPNPRDKILYKIENNKLLRGSNLRPLDFKLTYYNSTNIKVNYNSLRSSEFARQNSKHKVLCSVRDATSR